MKIKFTFFVMLFAGIQAVQASDQIYKMLQDSQNKYEILVNLYNTSDRASLPRDFQTKENLNKTDCIFVDSTSPDKYSLNVTKIYVEYLTPPPDNDGPLIPNPPFKDIIYKDLNQTSNDSISDETSDTDLILHFSNSSISDKPYSTDYYRTYQNEYPIFIGSHKIGEHISYYAGYCWKK